jgi:hypothetical protein
VRPLHHTIRHTILKESPTNPEINNSSTDKRLTKNGKLITPTKKGTTELSLSFPSILKRAKRQNPTHHMKTSGNLTSTELARISMKLLQDPVPQPVNYSSMKSEEPSEKLNDKKNYDFLFVSNNLSKYLNF